MDSIYQNGTYLQNHPNWHEEDSSWKANHIVNILNRNSVNFKSLCEVGCGAGEIIRLLSNHYPDKECSGYEISPQAFDICKTKSSANLTFYYDDILGKGQDKKFDVVMAIDVVEHVEDSFEFLRRLKEKGRYVVLHIPLDLSVQTVLRGWPISNTRKKYGHIHYYTKETALETLVHCGYEVQDCFYTNVSLDFPNLSIKAKFLNFIRKCMFRFNEDLTVRLFGGFSIIVLAM